MTTPAAMTEPSSSTVVDIGPDPNPKLDPNTKNSKGSFWLRLVKGTRIKSQDLLVIPLFEVAQLFFSIIWSGVFFLISCIIPAANAVEEYLAEWFGLNQSKYQWAVDEFMDRQLSEQPQSASTPSTALELQADPMSEQAMRRDTKEVDNV